MTHVLKIWPEHFQAVLDGLKTVELRREDTRRFAVGDRLILREWDPNTQAYTGRETTVEVTHVLRDEAGQWLQPQVVALSFRVRSKKGSRPRTYEEWASDFAFRPLLDSVTEE